MRCWQRKKSALLKFNLWFNDWIPFSLLATRILLIGRKKIFSRVKQAFPCRNGIQIFYRSSRLISVSFSLAYRCCTPYLPLLPPTVHNVIVDLPKNWETKLKFHCPPPPKTSNRLLGSTERTVHRVNLKYDANWKHFKLFIGAAKGMILFYYGVVFFSLRFLNLMSPRDGSGRRRCLSLWGSLQLGRLWTFSTAPHLKKEVAAGAWGLSGRYEMNVWFIYVMSVKENTEMFTMRSILVCLQCAGDHLSFTARQRNNNYVRCEKLEISQTIVR